MLKFNVKSALEYTGTESTSDDWLEIPEVVPKTIIELQRHAKKVTEHLQQKETLETTADLRDFTEKNFKANEKTIAYIKKSTNDKFK